MQWTKKTISRCYPFKLFKLKLQATDPEADPPAEGDVPRDGEMVELQEVGDGAEPGQKCRYLLEVVVAQLHQRRAGEHPLQCGIFLQQLVTVLVMDLYPDPDPILDPTWIF